MKIGIYNAIITGIFISSISTHGMSDSKPKLVYSATLASNWVTGLSLGLNIAQTYKGGSFLESPVSPLDRIMSLALPYVPYVSTVGMLLYVTTLYSKTKPAILCNESDYPFQRRWYSDDFFSWRHLLRESPLGVMVGIIAKYGKLY